MNKLKNKLKSKIKKEAFGFGVEDLVVGAMRVAIIDKLPSIVNQRNMVLNFAFPQWHQRKRLVESLTKAINDNWPKLSPILKQVIKQGLENYRSPDFAPYGYEDEQAQMSKDPGLSYQNQNYGKRYSFSDRFDQSSSGSSPARYQRQLSRDTSSYLPRKPKHGDPHPNRSDVFYHEPTGLYVEDPSQSPDPFFDDY